MQCRGVRETIVGILTINIPILRPMFTRPFWSGGPFTITNSAHGGTSAHAVSTVHGGKYEMTSSVKGSDHPTSDGGSEEFIIGNKGVTVQTSYEVRTDVEKGEWSNQGEDYSMGGATSTVINGRAT